MSQHEYWNSPDARLHSGTPDQLPAKYDRFAFRIKAYISSLKLGNDWSILDIGCGDGELTRRVHEFTQWETYGCDLSDYNIEKAETAFPLLNFKQANVNEGLPYEDSMFDIIYSNGFIQYLTYDELDMLFGEIKRILKPSGTCIHLDFCDKAKFFSWFRSPFKSPRACYSFFTGEGVSSYLTNRLWGDGTRWHSRAKLIRTAQKHFKKVETFDAPSLYRSDILLSNK